MTNTIPNVPRELKPCPFCGGEPNLTTADYVHDDLTPMPVVECKSCSAWVQADDWNTRAPSLSDHVEDVRAMVADQSPAGEDGLGVIGWYTEDHLDDKSATTYSREVADRWLAKGWPITGIANAADAQAIIDGLRGGNDDLQLHFDTLKADFDQQAQRIGELEGLLREVRNGLSCENLHHKKSEQHAFDEPCKVLVRIDAALSTGKEGE